MSLVGIAFLWEYDVQTARFMLISRVQIISSMMYAELVMLTYPVLLNPSTPLKNLARVWHASGTRLARVWHAPTLKKINRTAVGRVGWSGTGHG